MIDYKKIADAIDHYSKLGYQYIEVPWIVSEESMMVTAPSAARLFSTFAGELVASGEQSFIEIREKLKSEKFPVLYQCVTPCFRDEPIHDELHLQYFIKNELIAVCDGNSMFVPAITMNYLVKSALDFFKKYSNNVKVINAPLDNATDNVDITINDIEVGSYGYRYYKDFSWIYGTGVAEPRLSQVLKL